MLYVKTAVCHQPGHPGLPSQVALLESEQDPGRRGTCVPPLTPRLAGHRGARVHRWALSGWALEAPLSGEFSQARNPCGEACHLLPQGIFPIQRSNPCLLSLLHCQVDSLSLSHLGSPRNKAK